MNDAQMTLLAFGLGLGLMAGYALRVSLHLLQARRAAAARKNSVMSGPGARKSASITEQKPRTSAAVR